MLRLSLWCRLKEPNPNIRDPPSKPTHNCDTLVATAHGWVLNSTAWPVAIVCTKHTKTQTSEQIYSGGKKKSENSNER